MSIRFDFACIGGDSRLAYMAEMLIEEGFRVTAYGLDTDGICSDCSPANSLKEAVSSSKVIICPIPFTRDQVNIVAKTEQEDLKIDALKEFLTNQHLFFAGCIPKSFQDFGDQNQIFMYDYMRNEELTIYNTIATAEGAIAEAIIHQPTNLHDSRCLILGYGRCAKTLSAKLKKLSADTAICARSKNALAEAKTCGHRAFSFLELDQNIHTYDYIFNTIPSIVLDESTLSRIRKDTFVVDIAPGGFDISKARELGLNAKLGLGLPGKYAPKSSAIALADVTLSVIASQHS